MLLYIDIVHSPLSQEKQKVVVISVFYKKIDPKPLFDRIGYEIFQTIFYSIHCSGLNTSIFHHYFWFLLRTK